MQPRDRIISLDLLRGFAAFAVALPHFFLYRGSTDLALEVISIIAVELFFVLSGFVLAPQIMMFLSDRDWRTLRVFYLRRWMRTLPPYVIALIATSILAGQLLSVDFAKYLFFVQNLAGPNVVHDYFPVAWSLAVEEWYYVVFPLACVALMKIGRLSPAAGTIVFIVLISLLRITATLELADWGEYVRRATVFRIDSIAYGFLLYFYRDRVLALGARWLATAFVGTGIALALAAVLIADVPAWPPKVMFPFLAALWASSAIAALLALESDIVRIPGSRWLALWGGRISYSTYLFHLPILMLIRATLPVLANSAAFALYVTGITAVTLAMYAYIEAPVLEARPVYKTRSKASQVPSTMTAD